MTTEQDPKQPVPLHNEGHDFDGIQELDNDLPKWWVNLFLITIVFSAGYMAWFHLPGTSALSLDQEYLVDKMRIEGNTTAAAASGANDAVSFSLKPPFDDAAVLAEGKATFLTNCAACHGANGEGVVGPNLTDKNWIHAPTAASLLEVVLKGVTAKGMPAWEGVLGAKKSKNVLIFMASLQGSQPANPKAPEGPEATLQ